ncbi:hypothetical protein K7X08_017339 [Anisodus acutangulus]|uniref:C2H2-type domain-containing protein n=1 Tax=Anisodus acutangulus TaxID=402998 RepID=A0A9Q1R9H5_9SOLA|nr:hypothetical protein K7X08_017339 [Anisodus acutangulus]
MTNTGGSNDQGASENPQSSTRASPPPPATHCPATPVNGTPANPTTITIAGTKIFTSSSASAGGSSTAISASIGVGSSRSDVPPRKRGSMLCAGEGSTRGGAGEGDQPRNVRPNVPPSQPEPVAVPVEQRRCSVCQRVFGTVKGLFGHMNCHPDRGWKGVYPPPTFNREEEFADLQAQMKPNTEVADVVPVPPVLLPDLNISEPAPEWRITPLLLLFLTDFPLSD